MLLGHCFVMPTIFLILYYNVFLFHQCLFFLFHFLLDEKVYGLQFVCTSLLGWGMMCHLFYFIFFVFRSSTECQGKHWKSGHKTNCKVDRNSAKNSWDDCDSKNSGVGGKSFTGIALVPAHGSGTPKSIKKAKEVFFFFFFVVFLVFGVDTKIARNMYFQILFPYDEFVKLFDWDKPGFRPCGLLNCGNRYFTLFILSY